MIKRCFDFVVAFCGLIVLAPLLGLVALLVKFDSKGPVFFRQERIGKGGINGGIMTPEKGDWPAKLTLYIDVEDVEAYGAKIVAAGGKMIVPKLEVPGVGFMALFSDPDDRVLGLWQQDRKPD